MKQYAKQNGIVITSLLLTLSTAYFICIAVVKHEIGVGVSFDTIAPFLFGQSEITNHHLLYIK